MFYSKSTGGFYITAIHGDNIPPDAVEITAEQHSDLLQAQSTGASIQTDSKGYPVAVFPPEKTLAELQAAACAITDQTAGSVRQKYITTSPGQEATYGEKSRQCDAYKAAGYPAPPDPVLYAYIIAEKNARGDSTTYQQACDAILAERDTWSTLGAKIEEARRKAKLNIKAATTAEGVETAKTEGLTELSAL
jgi:hypothetical protein